MRNTRRPTRCDVCWRCWSNGWDSTGFRRTRSAGIAPCARRCWRRWIRAAAIADGESWRAYSVGTTTRTFRPGKDASSASYTYPTAPIDLSISGPSRRSDEFGQHLHVGGVGEHVEPLDAREAVAGPRQPGGIPSQGGGLARDVEDPRRGQRDHAVERGLGEAGARRG